MSQMNTLRPPESARRMSTLSIASSKSRANSIAPIVDRDRENGKESGEKRACKCTRSTVFWTLVFIVVVSILLYQGITLAVDYYNQETGTRVVFVERKDRAEIVDLIQLVYCPQDWLNESKVLNSQTTTPEIVAYAITLLPYVDFYALKALENATIKKSGNAGWTSFYYGPDVSWSNGEAMFAQLTSSKDAYTELEKQMKKLEKSSVLEFLVHFSNDMINASVHNGYTIRQGRICVIAKVQSTEFSNDGIDTASKIEFEFVHPPLFDKPEPEVFFSLYNYPTINSETDRDLNEFPSSVILGRDQNKTFQFTKPWEKADYSFFNQELEVTDYRKRIRYNKRKRKCLEQTSDTDEVYRYKEDYLLWQCTLQCTDEAFVKLGRNCSEFGVVNLDTTERPCSSGSFGEVREAYGAAFYGDMFFMEKYDQILNASNICAKERQCGALLECEEWGFTLNQKHGYSMVVPNVNTSFYHRYAIFVMDGITLIEYPLLSTAEFLGGLGGLLGLFLGASIITFIDWFLQFGGVVMGCCCNKKTHDEED